MQILLGCGANLISHSFYLTCSHVLRLATCWANLQNLLENNVMTGIYTFIYISGVKLSHNAYALTQWLRASDPWCGGEEGALADEWERRTAIVSSPSGQLRGSSPWPQPSIHSSAAKPSWCVEDPDRLSAAHISVHVIAIERCLSFMVRCKYYSVSLITTLHQPFFFLSLRAFGVLMTFIWTNLISLQTATTFLVFTSACPEWDLFCLKLKGRQDFATLFNNSSLFFSSWNRMLGCDKAQEEADKKQVAQTMTDTESDSDELNTEYSTELPNAERCLWLLLGIFMACRSHDVPVKGKFKFVLLYCRCSSVFFMHTTHNPSYHKHILFTDGFIHLLIPFISHSGCLCQHAAWNQHVGDGE